MASCRAARRGRLLAALVSFLPAFGSLSAQDAVVPAPPAGGFEGRYVLEALAAAYPGRFSAPEELDGEWSIRLDGARYAWAGGRLLPAVPPGAALAGAAGAAVTSWSPHPFYAYPEELPPLRPLTPAERESVLAVAAERDRKPPERNPDFFDRLWGSPDEESAWARMKTLRFLGREILVHRDILEELAMVEAEILEAARRDRSVGAWVEGIGQAGGYLWRRIAGTRSRSFHAYGVAVDLVPARTGGKAWYWLDARKSGLPWYELPYEKRVGVPRAVVAAFERQGFVWGGKWRFWDAVHFEFRPEILVLNGRSPRVQAPPAALGLPGP